MVDDTFQRLVEDNRALHRQLSAIRQAALPAIAYCRDGHGGWEWGHMLTLMDALQEKLDEAVDGH